ncbi:hypothetical protein [Shinella oryzae]|uniref:Uncharacterized protein n=1 Tax=Shinella oryzae TaxID=2871820 RepID=A0ABY9K216_9HYPH|nr:hypothetical protein [Shinella oryzae]WLS01694.1 hypothetical protein Q9315_09555 [Shinella oryzae]
MMPTDEMVDAAAKALSEAEGSYDGKVPWIVHAARAAVTAALAKAPPMNSPVSAIEAIEKAMEGVTPGPWRREAMGGSSTVTSASKPSRNDTRIPSYGYRDEEHCLAYPFIEDDGRVRWDFVCFSHADAAYIATCSPDRMRDVLALARQAEALQRENAEWRSIVSDLIRAHAEGPGLLDCMDNAGNRYTSQFLADALSRARALLGGSENAE